MVTNKCPLIATINIKSSKELQESDMVLGDFNFLDGLNLNQIVNLIKF